VNKLVNSPGKRFSNYQSTISRGSLAGSNLFVLEKDKEAE